MPKLYLTDQLGRSISLNKYPEKIISLVPSITYLLFALGLDNEVAGITRFCKLPAHWKKQKTKIGGTKDIKFDRIAGLKPDIILANKEENTKEIVSELQKTAPVYVSDIQNLEDNYRLITDMGKIFNREDTAQKLKQEIQAASTNYRQLGKSPKKTAYFIWKAPWMTVGGDTFINHMLQIAGFDNIFADKLRYPEVDLQQLQTLAPEIILLSSEPYPFKAKEQKYIETLFSKACVLLVEGEPFTWFGAYSLQAFAYFQSLQKQIDLCIQEKKN